MCDQMVHVLWTSAKGKDITAVNKSAADCGFLADHSGKVTEKSVKSDDGYVMTYSEADDERLQKDMLNVGFLSHNLRRLWEGWVIVHGKAFADKVYDGWKAMAKGLHNAVSEMGAVSHNAIVLSLQLGTLSGRLQTAGVLVNMLKNDLWFCRRIG